MIVIHAKIVLVKECKFRLVNQCFFSVLKNHLWIMVKIPDLHDRTAVTAGAETMQSSLFDLKFHRGTFSLYTHVPKDCDSYAMGGVCRP